MVALARIDFIDSKRFVIAIKGDLWALGRVSVWMPIEAKAKLLSIMFLEVDQYHQLVLRAFEWR